MVAKSRNKYARGNLQLIPLEKVYVPKIKTNDDLSYLSLSGYIILAGLIKGDSSLREHILSSIKSHQTNYFHITQFPYFLFQSIVEWLDEDINRKITPELFLDKIFDFFPIVWGYKPKWPEIRDKIYLCSQFYYMEFTLDDIDHAIDMRKHNPLVSVDKYLRIIKEKSE